MESALRGFASENLTVIETLRFEPENGFSRLALHIDRAEATCAKLGFDFDRGVVLQKLGEAVGDVAARCRIGIGKDGVEVDAFDLPPVASEWVVGLSDVVLQSDDPWLGVKTSNRVIYDQARANLAQGLDEVIFANERCEICEGSISSIFVKTEDGLITPPLSSGLLPGVLRQELIETGKAREGVLFGSDLANGFYVGNSLRGLIKAKLAH